MAASDSERPSALDTTKDKYDKGRGSSALCPRVGGMILESWRGQVTGVTTNCNTWSCVACRERNLRRFKAIVKSGCSTLGRCSLMTITYKAGSRRLRDADCVSKDWQALTRVLKRESPWIRSMQYLKVKEMTKKGTPHLHIIFGTVPQDKMINCWRRGDFRVGPYRRRIPTCPCFSHAMARAWSAVTDGESYICFAVPVTGAAGAASYLAKYMAKTMFRDVQGRRYSKSLGWPSEKRRRLLPGPKGWRRHLWTAGGMPQDLDSKWDEIPKSGTERQKQESHRETLKRFIKLGEQHGNVA